MEYRLQYCIVISYCIEEGRVQSCKQVSQEDLWYVVYFYLVKKPSTDTYFQFVIVKVIEHGFQLCHGSTVVPAALATDTPALWNIAVAAAAFTNLLIVVLKIIDNLEYKPAENDDTGNFFNFTT